MTNFEHYKNEILDIVCKDDGMAFSIHENKVVPCSSISCMDCKFHTIVDDKYLCAEFRAGWLKSEYEEPKVDWSTIPVDTKVLVRDGEDNEWKKRYFAKYENEKVYTFADGGTSWSSDVEAVSWNYAKLADEK